jgi:hypothetical protein
MIRRSFLGMLGVGAASSAVLAAARPAPAAPGKTSGRHAIGRKAGAIDLSDIDVVDSHMHTLRRTLLSAAYENQSKAFADAFAPPGDFPGKAELLSKMGAGFTDLIWEQPRRIGYLNYIARTYGVPATLEGFDSIVKKHIGSDEDFTNYIRSIFDREKIRTVVLQSDEPDPSVPPKTAIPPDRFVWTWPFAQTFLPSWARRNNATTLQDVLSAIDRTLETAVASGCRGFKNVTAYYRSFDLGPVTRTQAEAALKSLLAATAVRTNTWDVPVYGEPELNAALRTYQDYLFKHVYIRAGELERPVIIHTAVALHPSLRPDYNSPLPLYDVFADSDIQKAGTRFILIHTGFPSHQIVAAMVSQFPNVYTDVSFFSKYPGVLEEVYRAILAIAPAQKVMHGSDANTVPEEIGYCCWNSRAVLAKVLGEYETHYGWTRADTLQMANSVLHENARKMFRI